MMKLGRSTTIQVKFAGYVVQVLLLRAQSHDVWEVHGQYTAIHKPVPSIAAGVIPSHTASARLLRSPNDHRVIKIY